MTALNTVTDKAAAAIAAKADSRQLVAVAAQVLALQGAFAQLEGAIAGPPRVLRAHARPPLLSVKGLGLRVQYLGVFCSVKPRAPPTSVAAACLRSTLPHAYPAHPEGWKPRLLPARPSEPPSRPCPRLPTRRRQPPPARRRLPRRARPVRAGGASRPGHRGGWQHDVGAHADGIDRRERGP